MAKKKTRWQKISKNLPFALEPTHWVMKNLPFIFYVAFLGFIYIANARYAEKKVRRIQTLQKEIQKVSWEYLSIKSDLMLKSMQTEVTREGEKRGLNIKELEKPPKKIIIKSKDY
ncbi:MAG: FtsL-like putative cell division protein [Saprospiraceae bacterium]|jgi:hypothetical protein